MKPNIKTLRSKLKKLGDPSAAKAMQTYMKSEMPYHGVKAPVLRTVSRDFFEGIEFSSRSEWDKTVWDFWGQAKYREERYCAIHLTRHRTARDFQVPASMRLYERLIVSGAWWDYVDDLAIHQVGPILASQPRKLVPQMIKWSQSPNVWKRRSSIICQIGLKDKTDFDLLYDCIEPSITSKEFFLRKAIGWALRQVAWTYPQDVLRYIKTHETELSPLTKREALKNIDKVR